jgi:hypothetical protein
MPHSSIQQRRMERLSEMYSRGILIENYTDAARLFRKRMGIVNPDPHATKRVKDNLFGFPTEWRNKTHFHTPLKAGLQNGRPPGFEIETDLYQARAKYPLRRTEITARNDMINPLWQRMPNIMGTHNIDVEMLVNQQEAPLPFSNDNFDQISTQAMTEHKRAALRNPQSATYALAMHPAVLAAHQDVENALKVSPTTSVLEPKSNKEKYYPHYRISKPGEPVHVDRLRHAMKEATHRAEVEHVGLGNYKQPMPATSTEEMESHEAPTPAMMGQTLNTDQIREQRLRNELAQHTSNALAGPSGVNTETFQTLRQPLGQVSTPEFVREMQQFATGNQTLRSPVSEVLAGTGQKIPDISAATNETVNRYQRVIQGTDTSNPLQPGHSSDFDRSITQAGTNHDRVGAHPSSSYSPMHPSIVRQLESGSGIKVTARLPDETSPSHVRSGRQYGKKAKKK